MWKRNLDIFPGEWFGTEHEEELKKELEIGDYVKVIVDSQFQDKYTDGEKCPRAFGRVGKVIEIDSSDEWSYRLEFEDGTTNWFKRYILEKTQPEKIRNIFENHMDKFMNEPIDYNWTNVDVLREFNVLQDKKKTVKIYQITVQELNKISREG